jgi:hypothetical protein
MFDHQPVMAFVYLVLSLHRIYPSNSNDRHRLLLNLTGKDSISRGPSMTVEVGGRGITNTSPRVSGTFPIAVAQASIT